MRRSADALKAPTYVEDKNSGELRRPHHIDMKTGDALDAFSKTGLAPVFLFGTTADPPRRLTSAPGRRLQDRQPFFGAFRCLASSRC